MRCHQLITGACNSASDCFSVGTLHGSTFITYATGCDLVLLDGDFSRVQVLSEFNTQQLQITCVDCSDQYGFIAASSRDLVFIFEPFSVAEIELSNISSLKGYRWRLQSELRSQCLAHNLALSSTGDSLLVGGQCLQIWQIQDPAVKFSVGTCDSSSNSSSPDMWQCVWSQCVATPVYYMSFSNDGRFFATCASDDRHVKIWFATFEDFDESFTRSDKKCYDFIYITHPLPITHLEWRNSSCYMMKGMVCNALLTSCQDNVCRLWLETRFRSQNGPAAEADVCTSDLLSSTSVVSAAVSSSKSSVSLPSSPVSCQGTSDKYKFGRHSFNILNSRDNRTVVNDGTRSAVVYNTVNFCLAASINSECDIPLVPSMSAVNGKDSANFRIHWLNNKEHIFNLSILKSYREIQEKFIDDKQSQEGHLDTMHEHLNSHVLSLLREWICDADLLFTIHPIDGSFLIWTVDYLDQFAPTHRQAQVSFTLRIPGAMPLCDVTCLCSRLCLYRQPDGSRRLVSKHTNGSLNLWHLTNSVQASASQAGGARRSSSDDVLLSMRHVMRVCGHRFQLCCVRPHPLLPLLLTTSHYSCQPSAAARHSSSELIVWKIDSINALSSRLTGLSELTRMGFNSLSAFDVVAWFPSFLSSSIISLFDYPCVFFVASKSDDLCIYRVVIDAQSLLVELDAIRRRLVHSASNSSCLSSVDSVPDNVIGQLDSMRFDSLVSQQSTRRPACILHVKTILDVTHDWSQVLCLHVFQERAILTDIHSARLASDHSQPAGAQPHPGADVEPFYIVLLENSTLGPILHMWKVVFTYNDDSQSFTDLIDRNVCVIVTKECTQGLVLPSGVRLLSAVAAVDYLTSASMLSTCLVPYHLITVCSDHVIRCWKCETRLLDEKSMQYSWCEWHLDNFRHVPTSISLSGDPLSVSVAYSARIACMYKMGKPFTRRCRAKTDLFINLAVTIYECESTGGTGWVVEDTINITNVLIPCFVKGDLCDEEDVQQELVGGHQRSSGFFSLDWVSCEDCTHVLSVSVYDQILLYARVSNDIIHANLTERSAKQVPHGRPLLHRVSSIAASVLTPQQISWMKIRVISLVSSTGLFPLPMETRWVRHGLLIVGMRHEMLVYSQWDIESRNLTVSNENSANFFDANNHTRVLTDQLLFYYASDSMKRRLQSSSSLANMKLLRAKQQQGQKAAPDDHVEYLPNYGLFEAARIAFPLLPQYHPKQLIELLNCGRLKRVKAILAHIIQYIRNLLSMAPDTKSYMNGSDVNGTDEFSSVRKRSLTVTLNPTNPLECLPSDLDDSHLDYVEVSCIPPLPLSILFQIDSDSFYPFRQVSKTYEDLFSSELDTQRSSTLQDIIADGCVEPGAAYSSSGGDGATNTLTRFGANESQHLTYLLSHFRLPELSSIDQLYLMALSDTVASLDGSCSHTDSTSLDSIDECGLRYILAMKNYYYLAKCLPPKERADLIEQCLTTSNIVWAFHSSSHEEILQMIPCVARSEPVWEELKQIGVGWWLRSHTLLQRLVEQLAKFAFQRKKDPMDAALYYILLRKKSVLAFLYKQVGDTRKQNFFSRDFSQLCNQAIAKKNAYECLGRQKLMSAAALFLMAGSLWDCVNILVDKLCDLQLAIIVCRLWSTTPSQAEEGASVLAHIFNKHVLGVQDNYREDDGYTADVSACFPHADPFLRSMVLWMTADYRGSLNTLLSDNTTPSVFNFYVFLRKHFMIAKHANLMPLEKQREISLLERRLYFGTAHFHSRAGCPMIALEVLSKLPQTLSHHHTFFDSTEKSPPISQTMPITPNDQMDAIKCRQSSINSGLVADWFASQSSGESQCDLSTLPPSSVPLDTVQSADNFDWSSSVLKSATAVDEPLQLDWGDHSSTTNDDDEHYEAVNNKHTENDSVSGDAQYVDIMCQQIGYVSCLQLMLEHLTCLDAEIFMSRKHTVLSDYSGRFRRHLYTWLQHQIQTLAIVCNFPQSDYADLLCDNFEIESWPPRSQQAGTLEAAGARELASSGRLDTVQSELRLRRQARRKVWLRDNQCLLETLLSYCNLQAGAGGALATVRMEFLLLLQDLYQDDTRKGLKNNTSSLPINIPLLSAYVNPDNAYNFFTDPIVYLHTLTQDIVSTLEQKILIPSPDKAQKIYTILLKNSSAALSSCLFQSLCDFHSENLGLCSQSHTAAFRRQSVTRGQEEGGGVTTDHTACSAATQWPGVSALRAALSQAREANCFCCGAGSRPAHILLLEMFVAVYASLCVYALVFADCRLLYRLALVRLEGQAGGARATHDLMWRSVFGAAVPCSARATCVAAPGTNVHTSDTADSHTQVPPSSNRFKTNVKAGSSFSTIRDKVCSDDRVQLKEEFKSPDHSLLSFLLRKINYIDEKLEDDYDNVFKMDSEAESDEEGYCSDRLSDEHCDLNSYSWKLMRCSCMRLFYAKLCRLFEFLNIDMSELAFISPLSHTVLQLIVTWRRAMEDELRQTPIPEDYVTGLSVNTGAHTLVSKYSAMFCSYNTPFCSNTFRTLLVKRLWMALVRQPLVQDLFVRALFSSSRAVADTADSGCALADHSAQPPICDSSGAGNNGVMGSELHAAHSNYFKIIHRDNDPILAFALNQANTNQIVISTHKDLQELDISLLMGDVRHLRTEVDYDCLDLNRNLAENSIQTYLVQKMSWENAVGSSAYVSGHNSGTNSALGSPTAAPKTSVTLRHKSDGIRRICSHPTLPVYICGYQDGGVIVREWTIDTPVATARSGGTYGKVNKVCFDYYGSKIGACNNDGNLSLWQMNSLSGKHESKPFFSVESHSRVCSDFTFVGCASLLATAGLSSDGRNVCIWDTLLSRRRCQVAGFVCHETGASSILYSHSQQVLISGGRRGDVCIFDVRKQQLRHQFSAHDSSIKCMALDESGKYFVTGSDSGDIRVWGLSVHDTTLHLPGEHARGGFFKQSARGVSQVHVDTAGRLFSCGGDGSMRLRMLPSC